MFRIMVFGIAAIMTPCLGGCVWLSQSARFKEPGPFGFSGPALHGYVATNWGHTRGLYLLWAHSWTEPPIRSTSIPKRPAGKSSNASSRNWPSLTRKTTFLCDPPSCPFLHGTSRSQPTRMARM